MALGTGGERADGRSIAETGARRQKPVRPGVGEA
jgi:hypothetical protein